MAEAAAKVPPPPVNEMIGGSEKSAPTVSMTMESIEPPLASVAAPIVAPVPSPPVMVGVGAVR
jgi:hypothetical protein